MQVVSFAGFAGVGKSTAANILAKHGFIVMSFADAIKDCLAVIFGWDRALLEGDTPESRVFRETVDPWWAQRLGIPQFTPRFAMKNFGTDVMRYHFHQDIWVMNVERRLARLEAGVNVVFGDVRHVPEIALTRRFNGRLIRIKQGPEPVWYETALRANAGDTNSQNQMLQEYQIHPSEWNWIGADFDAVIENDGTIEELTGKVLDVEFGTSIPGFFRR